MLELQHFFIEPPASTLLYQGVYDPVLVGFSVLVAVLSSYTALLVAQHVAQPPRFSSRRLWVTAGGLSLGFGIWAMHFVGMLAFSLPCTTRYDSSWTLISTIPGILASVLAVNTISRQALSRGQLIQGGLLIGAGVGTMHYTGMAAMRIDGFVRYNAWLFLLSVLVAVAMAMLALWLRFRLQVRAAQHPFRANLLSAMVLGLAVSGMHYTAMLAAYFVQGDVSAPDKGISSSMLAVIVLLISGLIMVVTIFATYIELPSLLSMRRSLRAIVLAMLGWTGLSWLGADNYYGKVSATYYQQQSSSAAGQISHVASNINHNLQVLKGIPQVVAGDPRMQAVLQRFGAKVKPSGQSLAQRTQLWQRDAQLAAANSLLARWANTLGADVIWLMNAAGDSVAASNAGTPGSFVGSNFADRDYFQHAQAGQAWQQYALGRISSSPGLYFSEPVTVAGQTVGAVIAKRNLAHFSGWTRQLTAFLVDANGVVILTGVPEWDHLALPGAPVQRLGPAVSMAQYRKDRFDTLRITPWSDRPEFGRAVLLGSHPQPWLLSSQNLMGVALSVHVAQPLDALPRHRSEQLWLFFLLAAAGSMLIVASATVVIYLRESRKMQTELRVAATAFESQQGMLITDAQQRVLRVNPAFTAITGYSTADLVGRSPHLLHSGRHDAGFYAAMWASVAQHGSWQGELWSRCKDGSIYPEWLLITAVKDETGQITHYVGNITDITARKQAESEINHLAFFDPLTGLPNRRLLLDRLKLALATAARSGQYGALLFIDLDNFKDLNDNRGHQVGDQLLQQVAQRLLAGTREGDTTARLGGDEFVVMIERMSPDLPLALEQARVVGEKILHALNEPYMLAGFAHRSTPSLGVAMFCDPHCTIDDLLKRADLAMYQAKAGGRNTLRFFDPEMQAVVNARAALESDLREAVGHEQFLLYYQAQVGADTRVFGAEVLLRWKHPTRGLVSPADFIPLAESSGLILPLGHWVLETACAQLARWASQPERAHLSISVNVSARQFRHPDFVDQVMAVVDHTGADPHRLKLELTESLLVNDVEDIIAKMSALQALGVGFSLDDFGTGYSSLSYLKRLPLDQLKIDQSFVRNIMTDSNDAAIAKMVIALAQSLGLAVIAEGVEQPLQRDFLAQLGCHAYQGYLFGRPLPLADFEAALSHTPCT